MRTQSIILNIGLNNNPKNVNQILAYFRAKEGILLQDYQLGESVYNDEIEPTLILKLSTNLPVSKIVHRVEQSCYVFTQECIPVVGDNFELLVYPPSWTDEKYTFNRDYFLTF